MSIKSPTAALIIIGNEILSGRTQDSNTQYIAKGLQGHGVALTEVRVVPDIESRIIEAVNEISKKADYVFTTGGIGPTHDDITASSIAHAFGVEVEPNAEAKAVMEAHYGGDWNPARLRMTLIPQGAKLIPNPVSGAPGFIIGNVHVMAGVPKIMQAMFDNCLPLIEKGAAILSKTVACSLRESQIAEQLTALQGRYMDLDIGSYPQYEPGPNNLNLVLRGTDGKRIDAAVIELMDIIRALGDTPHVPGTISH